MKTKSAEEIAISFGCFVSLGCCFLLKEDSDDFVPSAPLHTAVVSDIHTEISLLEKTVTSSPACDFAFLNSCSRLPWILSTSMFAVKLHF